MYERVLYRPGALDRVRMLCRPGVGRPRYVPLCHRGCSGMWI